MPDPRHLLVQVDVPEALADRAGALLLLLGAEGVEERDATTLVASGERPIPPGRCEVRAWLEPDAGHEALRAKLLSALGDDARVRIEVADDRDWVAFVRAQVEPVEIGRRLRIRATWHPPGPDDGRIEIVLDPGLAFGTGTHATTALCLRALEAILDTRDRSGPPPVLLDLGCGSGILSIAALHLGAARAHAIDNDPTAIEVTRENAARAGVSDRIEATTRPLGPSDPTFEIVAANIQLGVLLALAQDIARHLAPEGTLLLSGVLEAQVAELRAAYERLGLRHLQTEVEAGWACVHLQRPRLQARTT